MKQKQKQTQCRNLSQQSKKFFKYQTLLVLLFVALFIFVTHAGASNNPASLVINEIQFQTEDNAEHDYIEIYNPTDQVIDLNEYDLSKMTSSGKTYSIKSPIASKGTMLESKKYYLWASSGDKKFPDRIKADASTSQTIADKNAVAIIRRNDSKIIDGVGWGNISCSTLTYCEKQTFSKNITDSSSFGRLEGKDSDDNSQDFAEQKPTPKKENEKMAEKIPDPLKEYSQEISITELFPNPFKSQYAEYIELYNGSDEKVDLNGWALHDASKNGKYTFSESLIIEAKKYLAIFKKDFKFALNNSGSESVRLFDPEGKEVAHAEYAGSKKNVSYNFDGAKWHWSKFLTPGSANVLNNEPVGTLKIDEKIFVNVFANFSIKTRDADNEKVRVTWNFGDGHKSYLAKTRHKFVKTGKYEASVKFSDGSEDIIKNFTVEVEEFPHPEMKIVAINANPDGVDTGIESLTIANKEKQKINLNGWSIATGWKKNFVNHPIREDVIIKGKKEKEITNEVASFSLNNTKAKIQLRYPDGKVAHEVKYKAQSKTVGDDQVYYKEKGRGWGWKGGTESPKSIKSVKFIKQEDAKLSVGSDQLQENAEDAGVFLRKDAQPENQMVEDIVIARENKIISGSNDGVKIELLKSKPSDLHLQTVREIDGHYFFTSDVQPKEHYAIVFFKNIFSNLNIELNKLLNYFAK